jgi:hypothetical protein
VVVDVNGRGRIDWPMGGIWQWHENGGGVKKKNEYEKKRKWESGQKPKPTWSKGRRIGPNAKKREKKECIQRRE